MDINIESPIVDIIQNKLINYGMPKYSSLKPNIQGYLYKIETEIQAINQERKTAIETYKSHKINVINIINKIAMARQTVYNKNNREILEPYILKGKDESAKNDVFKISDVLKQKIKDLNETILKLQRKDLNYQISLDIIETLEKENVSKQNEVEKLNELNIQNIQMIDKLEMEIRRYNLKIKNNVIEYR